MGYNFFCRLCKQNKTIENKKIIQIVDPIYLDAYIGAVCTNCYYKLKTLLTSKNLTDQMKQQTLNVWGVEFG